MSLISELFGSVSGLVPVQLKPKNRTATEMMMQRQNADIWAKHVQRQLEDAVISDMLASLQDKLDETENYKKNKRWRPVEDHVPGPVAKAVSVQIKAAPQFTTRFPGILTP